jgi:hypothetical protein
MFALAAIPIVFEFCAIFIIYIPKL